MQQTRRQWLVCAAVAMSIAVAGGLTGNANTDLFEAVRNDDLGAVRTLLASGADANLRDDMGATALMHAAAWSSPDVMRALLDARADVNASTRAGATALMWATGNVTKIRLLLDRGTAANIRMKDGTTALVTAARRGNVDVMRLLLARGADPKDAANETTELLRVAFGEQPHVREVLTAAGLEPMAQRPPLTTFPALSNAALVRELLDMGVSPNPRGRFPIAGSAAFEGHVETALLLLERGADPNARGPHDVTPLMMAAAATAPSPAIVRVLIEKDADISARDSVGRTALDWAMLQGETPVARMLQQAGARGGGAAAASPAPVSRSRPARVAITEALARLQPGGPVLYERSKCISCHHQTLPLMAMTLARARGVPVDAEAIAQPVRAITDVWTSRRENLMLARSRDGGGANELTYGLVAFAEAGVPRNAVTDVAVASLLSTQRSDGSWVFLDTRPPQADNSPIPFTSMALRGLEVYAPPGLRQEIRAAAARALAFLRAAAPASTQDEAFTLLGFVWSGVSRVEAAASAKRLMALQRNDGGWAQLRTMSSDAYATGQALYALRASGMAPRDRAYQRGVAYLLRTQLEDGTWFVRSRAFGFQPYFETGFPHGADQFISASATAWAVIALVPVL